GTFVASEAAGVRFIGDPVSDDHYRFMRTADLNENGADELIVSSFTNRSASSGTGAIYILDLQTF
ncbi:MAG: hypothetical protein AAFV53_12190, partial [Myxococcota bacterium]